MIAKSFLFRIRSMLADFGEGCSESESALVQLCFGSKAVLLVQKLFCWFRTWASFSCALVQKLFCWFRSCFVHKILDSSCESWASSALLGYNLGLLGFLFIFCHLLVLPPSYLVSSV